MSNAITKATLAAKVAALEARLTVAAEVYKNQRALIRTLEARLASPGIKPTLTPIVTRFSDTKGNLWEKTRVGSKATSRIIITAEDDDPIVYLPAHVSRQLGASA